MSAVPVVGVVGRKGAGKTTLVEGLVAALTARGWRIGTLKHHPHPFEIDIPGKDSWRHFQAGAEITAISSPFRLALVIRPPAAMHLREIVERFFTEVDLVLAEGFKGEDVPKIEIARKAVGNFVCHGKGGHRVIAVVTDGPPPKGIEAFGPEEVEPLAGFLERRLLGPHAPPPTGP